jgi:hypothetical protein
MHPQVDGVSDDERPMILAQVDELERDHTDAARVDHEATANGIESG